MAIEKPHLSHVQMETRFESLIPMKSAQGLMGTVHCPSGSTAVENTFPHTAK